MLTTPPLSAAALQLLQQVNRPAASKDHAPAAGVALVAAANGVHIPGVSSAQSQAEAKISAALFDNPVDIQQIKFNLFRRLGEELGVNMDDYESPQAYASAIRFAISEIKAKSTDNGAMFLAGLEKELGLDDLGITLDDLISAIDAPDGEGAKKLDEALREQTGEDLKSVLDNIKIDEAGLYGF